MKLFHENLYYYIALFFRRLRTYRQNTGKFALKIGTLGEYIKQRTTAPSNWKCEEVTKRTRIQRNALSFGLSWECKCKQTSYLRSPIIMLNYSKSCRIFKNLKRFHRVYKAEYHEWPLPTWMKLFPSLSSILYSLFFLGTFSASLWR